MSTMSKWAKILEHLDIARTAFRRWMLAQAQDAILVGVLWLIGLLIIGVPLAPLWALLGALFQFIPHLGTVLALIGPAFSAALSRGWLRMIYVLILYAGIVAADGLVMQPMLMKRTAKVPIWASIPTPIILGIFLNVWGVLLAPALLAIIFAYRERRKPTSVYPKDEQNDSSLLS
jgi:predicted PurR-regulated permease PerM